MELADKKVVLVIAFEGYQDKEYQDTRDILEKQGVKIVVASKFLGEAKGKLGGQVKIDILIDQIDIKNFDAVVFIGGPGAVNYIEDFNAHKLAQEAQKAGKVLAAICIAPAILARAGVLIGKKATIWSSATDKEAIEILKANKAIFTESPVVIDGKIITACGPDAAIEFGKAVADILKK